MERIEELRKRYDSVCSALECIQDGLELLKENQDTYDKKYKVIRSGVIHNYETALDTFWKFLKLYLECVHKVSIEAATPKKVFMAAADCGVLGKENLSVFFRMIDDRNYTTHTYQEIIAEEIKDRLPEYYQVLYKTTYKDIKIPT